MIILRENILKFKVITWGKLLFNHFAAFFTISSFSFFICSTIFSISPLKPFSFLKLVSITNANLLFHGFADFINSLASFRISLCFIFAISLIPWVAKVSHTAQFEISSRNLLTNFKAFSGSFLQILPNIFAAKILSSR